MLMKHTLHAAHPSIFGLSVCQPHLQHQQQIEFYSLFGNYFFLLVRMKSGIEHSANVISNWHDMVEWLLQCAVPWKSYSCISFSLLRLSRFFLVLPFSRSLSISANPIQLNWKIIITRENKIEMETWHRNGTHKQNSCSMKQNRLEEAQIIYCRWVCEVMLWFGCHLRVAFSCMHFEDKANLRKNSTYSYGTYLRHEM